MALDIARHRFTVAEYHQMAAAGVLRDDDRVELVEGEIVDMAPIGAAHIACVVRLDRLFNRGIDDVVVQVQSPIRLDEHTEPQPDLALLRPQITSYPASPEDVLLLVEVADTTLAYDRGVKLPLYARAGIPEVWLVDLSRRAVLVHREPSPEGYRTTIEASGGDLLGPLAFPAFGVTADQILG